MALVDNIISYWKFDENTGLTVGDSAGSNTGTWQGTTGAQWTTGLINSGGNFNGTDNSVKVNHAASLVPTDAITVAIWVKPAASQNSFSTLISKGSEFYFEKENSSPTSSMWNFSVHLNGNEENCNGFTPALSTTDFHLVVGTYDKITGAILLYTDGALSRNNTIVGNFPLDGGTNDLYIGQRNGFARQMTAVIDEVGIWSRALSAAEILSLYNTGLGIQYPFTAGGNGIIHSLFLRSLK